jgi:hypothetical protein
MFYEDQKNEKLPAEFIKMVNKEENNFSKLAKNIYESTELDNGEKTMKAIDKDLKDLLEKHKKDKVTELYMALVNNYSENVSKKLNEVQTRINQLQRTYMQAQMDVFKEKRFYTDAKSTLRVTYGYVKG